MSMKERLTRFFRDLDARVADHVGPIRVLFVVRNEIGFANQAPVIREMLNSREISIRTMPDTETGSVLFTDPELKSLYQSLEIAPITAVFRKWHYRICTDMLNTYFKRDSIHITIGHGASFGNLAAGKDWITQQALQPSLSMLFGTSPWLKKHIESGHPGLFNPEKKLFIATGFPKLDALVNNTFSREETLAALGLPTDRKTVLVTSHWTPSSILATWKENIIDNLAPLDDELNVIVTAHPNLWNEVEENGLDGQKLWQQLKVREQEHTNIRVIKSGNSLKLLHAADLLIFDNSSIRVEYSALDRPALFFKNPDHHFFSPVTQKLYEESADCFSSLDNFAELVLAALENPERNMQGRRALQDYFLCNVGKSSKTITDIILKVGRISNQRSANWSKAASLYTRSGQENAKSDTRIESSAVYPSTQ